MKLSHSKANCFNQCQQQYYLRYEQGYKPKEKKSWLDYGTAIDTLMEIFDKNGLGVALNSVSDHFTDPYDRIDASYVIANYYDKFKDDLLHPFKLNGLDGNQFPLNIQIHDDLEFNGFIDKVIMVNDELAFKERKTTSEPINESSSYWNKLDLDPQISGYSYGLTQIANEPVQICIYEVFRKPSKTVSVMFDREKSTSLINYQERVFSLIKAPPKQEMIARRKVVITRDRRNWWLNDHNQVYNNIINCKANDNGDGKSYIRNTNSCDNFGGCEFRNYCNCRMDLQNMDWLVKTKGE